MTVVSAVEVQTVGSGRVGIMFDSRGNLVPCSLEPQRNSAASRKKIEDPWFASRVQTLDLLSDDPRVDSHARRFPSGSSAWPALVDR
jgi:hypothetical protein